MDTKEAVELFGSQDALARALGCTPSAVNQWVRRGVLPLRREMQLKKLVEDLAETGVAHGYRVTMTISRVDG